MPTYIVKKETVINRQEGDVADVEMVVPKVLDMTDRTAKFVVVDRDGTSIIDKESPNDITITGQNVLVPLAPEDTAGHAGENFWALKVSDDDGPITVGKGRFVILKKPF